MSDAAKTRRSWSASPARRARLMPSGSSAASPSGRASDGDVEVGCVLSDTAHQVWELECGGAPEDLGVAGLPAADYDAPFASGSAGWHAMVVVPCSMGTAGRIAHGIERLALDARGRRDAERAAHAGRRSARSAACRVIHLENLVTLARAGALVCPPPRRSTASRRRSTKPSTPSSPACSITSASNTIWHRWGAGRARRTRTRRMTSK